VARVIIRLTGDSMPTRARSVKHAEYEILNHIISAIDLSELEAEMVNDEVSKKRFDTAATNSLAFIKKRMVVRASKE